MRVVSHIITTLVAAAVLLGVPFAAFADIDGIAARASGIDTVSSATAMQDAPSGNYTILINRAAHPNDEVLADWMTFFSGEAAPLIMEDIDCIALAGDATGIEMAESLQSRLPENQMKLTIADPVLALSKADAGLFDVLVMSDEAYAAFSADSVEKAQDVETVRR